MSAPEPCTVQQKLRSLRSRGFPSAGSIELTRRCNLRCKYCFIEPSSEAELSTDQLRSVLDRMADAGILTLLLTGGEPFIRDDILDIFDHAIRRKFFEMSILSNGTLMTDRHIRFLIANSSYFGYIRFSFFSRSPRVHDAFTCVPGSFHRALACADSLKSGGFRVVAIVNLTEENVDDLAATKAFFSSRGFEIQVGASKICTSDRIRPICGPTTTREFYKRYLGGISEKGRAAMRLAYKALDADTGRENFLCENLFGMVSILATGDVVPCLSIRDCAISNVITDDRPLPEILRASPLIKSLRSLRRSDIEPCGSCRFLRYCILCPGMMYAENGSFVKPIEQSCNYANALYETLFQ